MTQETPPLDHGKLFSKRFATLISNIFFEFDERMIIMQSDGRIEEKRGIRRVKIKHKFVLRTSPAHAHEKKARDDFSSIAVPLNQQSERSEPDCEMLKECSLRCSWNGERLPHLTKRAGRLTMNTTSVFALRQDYVILLTRKRIYSLRALPGQCYLHCLLRSGNTGPTARNALIALLRTSSPNTWRMFYVLSTSQRIYCLRLAPRKCLSALPPPFRERRSHCKKCSHCTLESSNSPGRHALPVNPSSGPLNQQRSRRRPACEIENNKKR